MIRKASSAFRKVAKPLAFTIQRELHLRPRSFCLVTGAPRSGTTALSLWLLSQKSVVGLVESRILLGVHRLATEIHRFKDLHERHAVLERMASQLAYDFYAGFGVFFGGHVLVDKEPLEPIAFPDRDYSAFLRNLRGLFPDIRFLLMIRDPVPTLWSMTQREWGHSLRGVEPRKLTLEDHIENWCSCAELALEYAADPKSYVCDCTRLVEHPEEESRRILAFLGIRKGHPVRPRPTRKVAFGHDDLEIITRATSEYVEALGKINRA